VKPLFLRQLFISILLLPIVLAAQKNSGSTKLVLLGTGTPFADPDRSGPSLAIVVNETAYVVDCGPGVVRRAAAIAKKNTGKASAQKFPFGSTHSNPFEKKRFQSDRGIHTKVKPMKT